MYRILLIDDDESLQSLVGRIAERDGFAFAAVSDGVEGLAAAQGFKPDLIILDVMLPGMNGFDICEKIRERDRTTPILILSAKGDIVDKSVGFRAGADDYLVKPFNIEELSLRIEAHLRRKQDILAHQNACNKNRFLAVDDLEIYFDNYVVRLRGEPVQLSSKEFEVLALLASAPGKVFTREQILNYLWGNDDASSPSSVTVFIRKIREKIEDVPAEPRYLLTVWRVGYKFVEIEQG
jgi:DNA-binding response OmpR family regulator